jgi:hypothetical protein
MRRVVGTFMLVLFLPACGLFQPQSVSAPPPPATVITVTPPTEVLPTTTSPPEASPTPSNAPAASDKWSLWTNGTQLRGANIYQRRVYPEFDGTEFLGPGPFGPPYTQADFDRLAALGANYVNISHAGLFTVEPPYQVDEEAVANLDRLLAMIAQADMFAVITFRSGPGRSEFAIIGGGDWLPDGYIIESVWQDAEARAAWAEMWRYTAERYKDHPIVVGYDLMCEPNANAGLDIWEAEAFYDQYAGSGYDWNAWYPSLVSAIREVDASTPILVGGNNYSGVEWLPYLQPVDDAHIVYTIHQYSPHEYTHQDSPDSTRTYPGYFDTDYDDQPETFDRAWLEGLLSIAADFQSSHQAVLAVNEYGLERWASGGAEYVRDQMALFEQYGWNYAAWQWHASWPPLAEGDNSFNFLFGPDPSNLNEVPNALLQTYQEAWARNTVRPSNFGK